MLSIKGRFGVPFKVLLFGLIGLAMLLVIVGCSTGSPEQVEVIKEVPIEVIKEVEVIQEVPVEVVKEVEVLKEIEVERVVEKIKGTGGLVVYSGRSEKLVGPIIEQFASVSGIDVKVKYGKTAAMAATILEEGENSPADLFFAQDPGGLSVVGDLLTPISGDILGLVPNWASSSKNNWVGISGRARTVVYNPNNTDESDLPDLSLIHI